jgi:CRP/FNR family transcriptional regulator, anaerobic regulatory protein
MAWGSVESVAIGGRSGLHSGTTLTRVEPFFSHSEAGSPDVEPEHRARRTLNANEFLFQAGDLRKQVFRVESGAICLYEGGGSDRKSVVEFLFPGDFVGLGFLEKHGFNARALLETSVECLTLDSAAEVIRNNAKAKTKLAGVIEREFEIRREELRGAGQRQPVERVAALLVTSARTNVQEGRAPDLIEDSWRCGVIADLLRLSLDELTALLVELERRGLITATANGLRLQDIAVLEALADGVQRPAGDSNAAYAPTKSVCAQARWDLQSGLSWS